MSVLASWSLGAFVVIRAERVNCAVSAYRRDAETRRRQKAGPAVPAEVIASGTHFESAGTAGPTESVPRLGYRTQEARHFLECRASGFTFRIHQKPGFQSKSRVSNV